MGKMYKMINNKKGFTLIELIVVIAIIGILAAIAVPRVTGFRGQAEAAAQRENSRVIEKAAELYFASNNGRAAHAVTGVAVGDALTGLTRDEWILLLQSTNMINAGITVTTITMDANGDATVTP